MNSWYNGEHPQPGYLLSKDAIQLFSDYLRVTGVAHAGPEMHGDPTLVGKRLGLLNGSSWISLWANYFGRWYLPGVQLVNAGNDAVQINFIEAHDAGQSGLPATNLSVFKRYALDLVELGHVDAILITCSTMNRAYPQVLEALQAYKIPVLQVDRPMMERALEHGRQVLIVATHGPTMESSRALLEEVAAEAGQSVRTTGVLVEPAWKALAGGNVDEHNEILARTIRDLINKKKINSIVLAQLSMSVFLLSFPDPLKEFGIPVLTSGQCGFEAIRKILVSKK